MYEGQNPTAIRSQQWLMDALLSLMKDIPYSKITIKDICIKADLSRPTFYNFFESKEEILHLYLHNCYLQLLQKLSLGNLSDYTFTARSFFEFFEEHKTVLSLLVENDLQRIIHLEISSSLMDFASQVAPNVEPRFRRYSKAFLSGALTQLLVCWITDDNPLSIDELTILLDEILSGNHYKIDL